MIIVLRNKCIQFVYREHYGYAFPNKSYNGVMKFKRLRFGMCFEKQNNNDLEKKMRNKKKKKKYGGLLTIMSSNIRSG